MGDLVAFRQRDENAKRGHAAPSDGTRGEIALFTGVRYERVRDFAARETDIRCAGSSDSPDDTAPGAGPHTRRA